MTTLDTQPSAMGFRPPIMNVWLPTIGYLVRIVKLGRVSDLFSLVFVSKQPKHGVTLLRARSARSTPRRDTAEIIIAIFAEMFPSENSPRVPLACCYPQRLLEYPANQTEPVIKKLGYLRFSSTY